MNQVAASIVASFDDITFTDAAVDMIKICLWHVVHKLVELLYKTDGTAETKLELVAHLDYEATTNIGIFRSRYGNKKRKVCTMEHVLYALDQLVRPTQALQYRYRQLQKHPDEVMEEARLQLRQNLEEALYIMVNLESSIVDKSGDDVLLELQKRDVVKVGEDEYTIKVPLKHLEHLVKSDEVDMTFFAKVSVLVLAVLIVNYVVSRTTQGRHKSKKTCTHKTLMQTICTEVIYVTVFDRMEVKVMYDGEGPFW